MAQKGKPNFKPYGNKRSGPSQYAGSIAQALEQQRRKSKGQSGSGGNDRKTHDTKGKNTHGRRSW